MEESRTALVGSQTFRFLGISIFTVTIIETIIFYSDTWAPVLILTTLLIWAPINAIVCLILYLLKINNSLMSNCWMGIIEPVVYCAIFATCSLIYNVLNFTPNNIILVCMMPYILVIPILYIQEILTCKLKKSSVDDKNRSD